MATHLHWFGLLPRRGKRAGHTVTAFFLNDMDIHGCRGCFGGHSSRPCPCVQSDDMDRIYPAVRDCDVLVLASPLYYWNMSGSFGRRLTACSRWRKGTAICSGATTGRCASDGRRGTGLRGRPSVLHASDGASAVEKSRPCAGRRQRRRRRYCGETGAAGSLCAGKSIG